MEEYRREKELYETKIAKLSLQQEAPLPLETAGGMLLGRQVGREHEEALRKLGKLKQSELEWGKARELLEGEAYRSQEKSLKLEGELALVTAELHDTKEKVQELLILSTEQERRILEQKEFITTAEATIKLTRDENFELVAELEAQKKKSSNLERASEGLLKTVGDNATSREAELRSRLGLMKEEKLDLLASLESTQHLLHEA